MYKFFAFLDRMKYIKRWSLMRSTREETIMEHTQQVTVLSHALALINLRWQSKYRKGFALRNLSRNEGSYHGGFTNPYQIF